MATTQTKAATSSGEMCRLTICGPASQVELAVPAHVPLADLMPTVLGHLDPALATTGLPHGGWVLQRLGEPPLDEDHGTAAAGLYDGDVLHLRPRDELLPLVDFDDLVDGVHTALSKQEDKWRPALTRRACVAAMGLCAATAVPVAALAGSGWAAVSGAAGLAVALLAAAAAVSRVLDDRTSAVVLAAVAMFAAAVAGLAVPMGGARPEHWFSGPGVFSAGVAIAVAAAAARALLRTPVPAFTSLAAAGVLTAAGGAIAAFAGFGAVASSSIVVTVALLLTKVAPTAAARAAGLVIEAVPTNAEEFQQGLDPLPSGDVLDRATRADALLTALLAALGVLTATGLTVVGLEPAWDSAAFTGAASLLLLLHARELTGTWHRLSVLFPAATGLVVLACTWAVRLHVAWWATILFGLLALSFAALAGAHLLPGRKLVPRWGRWGDIAHWACALAVIPLALSLCDVYGAAANAIA